MKQSYRGFTSDVITLSFGTLVGRLIAVAALPIVTQVYSPADFALLAVFLGVVSPLAVVACPRLKVAMRNVHFSDLFHTLRQNYRYPAYSTPEALLNVAGVQVPVLLIAVHLGPEAGFLLLTMQIMILPMTLPGSSVSQVYVSRAPEEHRDRRLAPLTISIMRRLVLIGVGPLHPGGRWRRWSFLCFSGQGAAVRVRS